jgi:hypothetical protein
VLHQRRRDADHVPAVALAEHCRDGRTGHLEVPAEVHAGDVVIVVVGVVDERLRYEDARVVHDGVESAEPFDGRVDDALTHRRFRDVARYGKHHRVVGVGDRA